LGAECGLGDKGFILPKLKQELAELGTYLETPLRDNMSDESPKSFIKWLASVHWLIETVIGQLERVEYKSNGNRVRCYRVKNFFFLL